MATQDRNSYFSNSLNSLSRRWLAGTGAIIALALSTGAVYADGPVTMAPPVQGAYSQDYSTPDGDQGNVSQDSVFNWREVPQDQQVPIQRAVFDQGGYQLYDTVGETIVIPFTDNNLYVMKFAESPNGTMFFVNGGDAPVLYVPRNGYLENATVPGARWFPLSDDFHPADPVFLGCAPSWTAFVGMDWYPDMVCRGGFWCGASFWDGGIFVPTVDLVFVIGGQRCDGWHSFNDFCYRHPDFVHVGFFHPNVYRWANRPHDGSRQFAGGHSWNGGGRGGFGGHNTGFGNDHGSNDTHSGFGTRNWNNQSNGRTFSGNRSWNNQNSGRTFSGDHNWNNQGDNHMNGDSRNWNNQGNGRVFRGGAGGDHTYTTPGGRPSFGERESGSNRGNSDNGGDRSSGGQSEAAPARVFGGGSNSGGSAWQGRTGGNGSGAWQGRSSGGSSSGTWQGRSSGGATFGGGDRSSGGDRSYGNRGGSDSGRSNNSGGNGGGGGWSRGNGGGGGNAGGGGGGHWGR